MMPQCSYRERGERLPGLVAGIRGGQRVSRDLLKGIGRLRLHQPGVDPG